MAQVQIKFEEGVLTALLSGDLDHHAAQSVRQIIDDRAFKLSPRFIVLDFDGVTFMDSSGVGLIMGRFKLSQSLNCELGVRGGNIMVQRIIAMAGIYNTLGVKNLK